MPYKLSHPEYLTLTGPDGTQYRGGDQEWYHDLWQRRAGCGPTTAAALLSYLAQAHPILAPMGPGEAHTQAGFLAYMEAIWPYVTPGSRGLDDPNNLVLGCRSFAQSRGCYLKGEVLPIGARRPQRPSSAQCRAFLAQALGRDCPVAFLNFSNGALKNLDSWHWVPLISMTEGDRVLLCTVLDEGEERVIDLDLWLDTTFLGGALVTLWPDPEVGAHEEE